jgi:beta-lactam-binding protein with PASTA domain
MKKKKIPAKWSGRVVWINLFAMLLVVIGVFIGLWFSLDNYTMHNIEVTVPNVKGMKLYQAKKAIEQQGLFAVVADSGYNKTFPAGTVLEQIPANDKKVKPGREIYLTINTTRTPTLQLPDIPDNSSLREAQARLKAMGIKLSPCEYVDGEKDWVYGVKYRGKNIFGGDRIPIGAELTLQIGSGQFSDSPEIETDTTNIENEVDSDLYEEESFGFDDLF